MRKKSRILKIRVYKIKKLNNEEITENKTNKNFNINQKFKIINIRYIFFKNEKNLFPFSL